MDEPGMIVESKMHCFNAMTASGIREGRADEKVGVYSDATLLCGLYQGAAISTIGVNGPSLAPKNMIKKQAERSSAHLESHHALMHNIDASRKERWMGKVETPIPQNQRR
ncbi:hypothetical protein JMJ77_0001811 [Colletotrichum scovillei]|uniref:Uncharacterized protein n=1 Tax=Colletotrichum scovillei TaxID=1209932 RepID=A0A9P7UJ14_9PEZI|nr:hypothetical protein JMJ77_0001811 [Colletotrichum scovillei]KAG7070222.1 hypothetical protein JMJ76_0001478 [Colletotrichum scovillei]KAG7078470.1 hypothetical protein JMJ78_0002141 [Colletotrichum scovillei]